MSDSDSFAQYDLIASYDVIFHHENLEFSENPTFSKQHGLSNFPKNGHKSSSVHAGESVLKYFW